MKLETYEEFATWHAKNHGKSYNTPTKAKCIAEMAILQRTYDEESDRFYYYTGQYHPTNPGELRDESWLPLAALFSAMYGSLARYGTN